MDEKCIWTRLAKRKLDLITSLAIKLQNQEKKANAQNNFKELNHKIEETTLSKFKSDIFKKLEIIKQN